jgi:DNA-binding MarR family transcriptional regulator
MAGHAAGQERRRLSRTIKESVRQVGAQLSRLNHEVGGRLSIRASDLECLDHIDREGPLSPTSLAGLTGQHPATLTGILDRLERGGWIARERDPGDRRGVVVRAERGRGAEILRLYLVDSGMNTALDEILAGYSEAELAVIADFLRRTTDAGRAASDRLSTTG